MARSLGDDEPDRRILIGTLDSLGVGIVLVDSSQRIVFCNEFVRRLVGRPIIGKKITDVLSGPDATAFDEPRGDVIVSLISDPSVFLHADIDEFRSDPSIKYIVQLKQFGVEEHVSSVTSDSDSFIALLSGAHGAVWCLDFETNTLKIYSHLSGYTERESDHSSLTIDEFLKRIHPDDFEVVQTTMLRVLSGREDSFFAEFRFKFGNEDWRWVRATATVSYGGTDNPKRLLGILLDIDEIKQREIRSGTITKYLDHIINSVPSLIMITDEDMNIQSCNQAALKTLGYNDSELIGRPLYTIFAEEQTATDADPLAKQVVQTGSLQNRRRVVKRRDGSSLQVLVTYNVLTSERGTPHGLLVTMIDISEQEQMMESLREAQQHLRTERDRIRLYLDLAQVIILALDRSGRIVMINRAGCKLFGVDEDQIVGKYWFGFVPERERDVVRARFDKIMNGTLRTVDDVLRPVVTSDNEERIISWKTRPIYDSDGNVMGLLSSGVDMTDQLKAEALLRQERAAFRVVAEAALEAADASDVTKSILEGLSSALGFSAGIVWLYDCEKNAFVKTASFGVTSEYLEQVLPLTQETIRKSLISYAAQRRELIVCHDLQQCDPYVSFESVRNLNIHAAVVMPIVDRDGNLMSILSLISNKPMPQLEDSTSFFRALAEMIATAIDRAKSFDAIQRSEQRFRDLVLNSPEGIAISDLNDQFVVVNPAFAHILGYTPEEIVGTPIYDYIDAEGAELVREETRKRREGLSSKYQLKMRHKSGETRIVRVSAVPARDERGQVDGTFAVVVDVTDRVKAESELQESEKRYRLLVRSITEVILVVDAEGNVSEMYSNGHIIPQHDGPTKKSISEVFPRNVVDTLQLIVRDVLTTHSTVSNEFVFTIGMGGKPKLRWIVAIGTPYEDKSHVVLVLRDLTELRMIEAQMRAADRGASLYLDLLGHDIRNYLQAILINAEMLEEISSDQSVVEAVQSIRDAISNSTKLIATVQSSHSFLQTPLREVEINPILVECMEEIAFSNPDVTVESQILVPHARIQADRFIKTALMNLLDNAVRHNPSEEKRVWVSLRELRDGFQIEISDNGSGIADEQKGSIFNPSSRLSGIGIHQTIQIIEKYGGRIEILDRVQNDFSQGTTFRIWLPKVSSG